MNVLVVTGKMAEDIVRKSVGNGADILRLDIEVAAFTTPALLRRSLPDKKYDLILIPGLSSGDFSVLEKEIGTPIKLGPKHAIDLGFVLSFAEDTVFSREIPACELLIEKKRSNAYERINELEKRAQGSLFIRGAKLGGNSRMKVMAEIVDAAHLEHGELAEKILYFANKGADIIDLGLSLDTTPDEARNAVRLARSAVTDIPLSIDTLDPDLINEGLDAGVDIVLSLNSGNMKEVRDGIVRNSAVAVIIPDCSDDLESLSDNIDSARDSGIRNIIADPVLEPLGHDMVESINRYYRFRERDPVTPLFFGAGNVSELMDADSIGINAVLAGIAMELEASILFTPESSHKAYNSIFELRTASMMMLLARDRGSAPKDLGLDMLVVKEKRRRESGNMPESPIEAVRSEQWHLDPKGSFKIEITEDKIVDGKPRSGRIVARQKDKSIVGKTAKEILDTVIRLGMVSNIDHAGYLGRELMKAEIALKFRRSYSQDDRF